VILLRAAGGGGPCEAWWRGLRLGAVSKVSPLSRLRRQLPRERGTILVVEEAVMRAPVLTFKRARTLRREMTLPEVVLWGALRGSRLNGMRFRRQHPIGRYILDFYCPSTRLAVEIDGFAHDNPRQVEHDESRDAWLASRRVKVLRVAAADVLNDHQLEGVLLAIEQAAAPSTAFGGPPPQRSGGGTEGDAQCL
jgi:very-short-patch-repair endonuclease